MRFLIDEDMPRSTVGLLQQYGHEAISVREAGLQGAKDAQIIAYAQSHKLCLLTGDFDFSDIRNYPPTEHYGLVVFSIPKDSTASFILKMLAGFIQQEEILSQLQGKLAIVEPNRIRLRTAI